jgi:hypothetical protein
METNTRPSSITRKNCQIQVFNQSTILKAKRQRMNNLVDAVNKAITGVLQVMGSQFMFVDYDNYISWTGGRLCEAGVTEPDGKRYNTKFYGFGTVEPWEDANKLNKRSDADIMNSTFEGQINDIMSAMWAEFDPLKRARKVASPKGKELQSPTSGPGKSSQKVAGVLNPDTPNLSKGKLLQEVPGGMKPSHPNLRPNGGAQKLQGGAKPIALTSVQHRRALLRIRRNKYKRALIIARRNALNNIPKIGGPEQRAPKSKISSSSGQEDSVAKGDTKLRPTTGTQEGSKKSPPGTPSSDKLPAPKPGAKPGEKFKLGDIKKLVIPDGLGRTFHPRPNGHAIIAELVFYHMGKRQAEIAQKSYPPEVAHIAPSSCPVSGGSPSGQPSNPSGEPWCLNGADPDGNRVPNDWCGCGDNYASTYSTTAGPNPCPYTVAPGPTITFSQSISADPTPACTPPAQLICQRSDKKLVFLLPMFRL